MSYRSLVGTLIRYLGCHRVWVDLTSDEIWTFTLKCIPPPIAKGWVNFPLGGHTCELSYIDFQGAVIVCNIHITVIWFNKYTYLRKNKQLIIISKFSITGWPRDTVFPKRQFNCCIIQHSTASCSAQLNAMATANANVTAAQTASQPQTATSAPDPANSSNSKATTASSNSILQNRLSQCSQPKSYTAPGPHSPAGGGIGPNNHGQPPQQPQDHNSMDHDGHANFSSDLQQPESPSLKMKIKRSNSTNFSNGNSAAAGNGGGGGSDASTGGGAGSAGDKQTSSMESLNTSNQLAASKKQSANSKKRKDATTSSSSSSSSRSSSPRYYHIPPPLHILLQWSPQCGPDIMRLHRFWCLLV